MPKFKFKFLLFFLFFFSNFSQIFSNPFKFAARLVRRIEKSDGFFQDHEILSLTGKLKKVSELKVGDFVKTYNVKNKVFEDKQITKIEKKIKHLFFKVSATLKGVDENGKPKTLKIDFFKKQKLYLFNQEGWIFAKDLKPGDRVFCLNQASGFLEVESVGLFDCDNKDLYRISVKDNKNIFLSEFGILTHNFSIAYPIITVGSSLLKFVGVEVAQIIATTALVSAFLSHMQQERERFEKDEEKKKKLKNPSEKGQSSLEFSQPISKTGSVGIILGPSTIGFKASTTATISSSLALGAGVGIFTSLLIKSYVDSLKKEALEKEKALRDQAFEKELLEIKIEEEAKALEAKKKASLQKANASILEKTAIGLVPAKAPEDSKPMGGPCVVGGRAPEENRSGCLSFNPELKSASCGTGELAKKQINSPKQCDLIAFKLKDPPGPCLPVSLNLPEIIFVPKEEVKKLVNAKSNNHGGCKHTTPEKFKEKLKNKPPFSKTAEDLGKGSLEKKKNIKGKGKKFDVADKELENHLGKNALVTADLDAHIGGAYKAICKKCFLKGIFVRLATLNKFFNWIGY